MTDMRVKIGAVGSPKRSERLAGCLSVLMVEEGYMADMGSQNMGLLAILRGQKGWLVGCQS